jgi:hypothetical protein
MAAALLDPRSLQWMMMLGGGLMVLGVIVWLVSQGIFKNPWVVAAALTASSLALHLAGCAVALKTRFKIAGQALTFLGCILLPLNLWFYHSHGLVTLDGHLWLGGVVCCALYVATLLLLRDPLFMYAIEGGITLTIVLLLASQGHVGDAGYLSLVLMALALISIHAEMAFPTADAPFDRQRFGMPLFWSGHAQLAAALITLLVSQILSVLMHGPHLQSLAATSPWLTYWTTGEYWLARDYWLAGSLWLAGAYAYFYSDFVVRRVGIYVYLATACLLAAELTFIGNRLPGEAMIAIPAITAFLLTLASLRPASPDDRLTESLRPLALLLAALSVVIGMVHHVRATSEVLDQWGWHVQTGWPFVATMALVTACLRASAVLFQKRSPRAAADYLFLSAASVLVLLAGLLRAMGITLWMHQAPLLMLMPLGYIIAARLWRGRQPERPLAIAAHVGAAVIMAHVLVSTVQESESWLVPIRGGNLNLWLALVFGEAAAFYFAAAYLRRHAANIYGATLCICAILWQLAIYYAVPHEWYTVLYAILGLLLLTASRIAGLAQVRTFHASGEQSSALLGRGAAAFYSATALLSLAFLSTLLQGLARLSGTHAPSELWRLFAAQAVTLLAGLAAVALSPSPTWRRIYATWSASLACVGFLTLNVVITLSIGQKVEIFCLALGCVLLIGGCVGRFLETDRDETSRSRS